MLSSDTSTNKGHFFNTFKYNHATNTNENFLILGDITEEEKVWMEGVEYMIINGLRHKEHPTHQTIENAISFARQLGVKETWIVHMSHHIKPHADEEKNLPSDIHLAYDGEVITF